MTDESTVLNNLRPAHYGDWGLDLSSQEVHELWAEIEAKEIVSSCMQILSSQEVLADKDEQEPKPDPAELGVLVERLIEAGDRLSDSLCTYPEEEKTIEVYNWNAIVAEYKTNRNQY